MNHQEDVAVMKWQPLFPKTENPKLGEMMDRISSEWRNLLPRLMHNGFMRKLAASASLIDLVWTLITQFVWSDYVWS